MLCRAALSPEQVAAYDAIASASRRRELLTAIVMASSVLGRPLSHYDNGAPLLVGDDRRISISHTADFVAMAVDRKPVGVDIELLSRDVSSVAARVFAPEERAAVDDLTLWCVKEAAYKASGREGIDFRRDVRVSSSGRGAFEVFVATDRVEVVSFSLYGLMVAVTV